MRFHDVYLPFKFHLLLAPWQAQEIRQLVDDYEAALPQAQGLIGSTLLVAVPNELTREVLQTQVKDALDDALRSVFSDDIRCAIDVDTDLVPIHEEPAPPSNSPP